MDQLNDAIANWINGNRRDAIDQALGLDSEDRARFARAALVTPEHVASALVLAASVGASKVTPAEAAARENAEANDHLNAMYESFEEKAAAASSEPVGMGGMYFAIDRECVVVTPAELYDREGVWDDDGSEANAAIEALGLPLYELTESCYETDIPDDDLRALLVRHGAIENPEILELPI